MISSTEMTNIIGVHVQTSKPGKLWPVGYWKTLFDAFAAKGAKQDPRLLYADLATSLDEQIELREGRFFSQLESPLKNVDDSLIQLIVVLRVPTGAESIVINSLPIPTASWSAPISVPFFGTIGSSKYEAQSRTNQSVIEQSKEVDWVTLRANCSLGLSFQLSEKRTSRDLDNLIDGLMPLFNSKLPSINYLFAIKPDSILSDEEYLRVAHATPFWGKMDSFC